MSNGNKGSKRPLGSLPSLADEVRIATAKEETRSKSNPSSSTPADEIQPLACLRSEIERVRERRGD
jgi:hypothetical protein